MRMLKILCIICVLMVNINGSNVLEEKYTKNIGGYEVVYPIQITKNGNIVETLNARFKRSEKEEKPMVHYKLNIDGNEEIIDLKPNEKLVAPGAVLETRTHAEIDTSDPLKNIKAEPFPDEHCLYEGEVRGHLGSSIALSTCNGLSGVIRVKKHTYLIEPVDNMGHKKESDHPHLLYEHILQDMKQPNCATKERIKRKLYHTPQEYNQVKESPNVDTSLTVENLTSEEFLSNRSDNASPLHLETLLVLDKSMLERADPKDLENYVLTVFNMAQSLFYDASFDPSINLELVRMVRLEDENDKINKNRDRRDAQSDLMDFSDWQMKINPKDEDHPNHHDLAILLTRRDICDSDGYCHYVGIAEDKGTCDLKREAAICKDTGLGLGYVMAHQIAHTLGVDHDTGTGGRCSPVMPDGISSVMNPSISPNSRQWSECSRTSLKSYIDEGYLSCLEDDPSKNVIIPDVLPGVMYGADFQCQQLYSPEAKSCSNEGNCESLKCMFEGTACTNTGVLPAPGTPCGKNKWCYDRDCLEAGERPQSVNGEWGAWSPWSQCSRTCGSGVSLSKRECNNPAPRHGGKMCSGKRKRHKICSTQPCEVGSVPFRDIQCAAYNHWVFPEDGRRHHWKGYFLHDANPCSLFCKNEKGIVVSLLPKVRDGTTCYRGVRDICIDGVCKDIPCDLELGSKAVEDSCGLCLGNGTSCKVHQGVESIPKGEDKIITIPPGTRNIKFEETIPTHSKISIISENMKETYLDRNKLGLFKVPGSTGWLGMVAPNQKIVAIPGPITKPLQLKISADQPVHATYSMALPSFPRKGKYSWDYLGWGSCSAQCGEGKQESEPKCVETSTGHVDDLYCENLEKPKTKTRSCNSGACASRWLVGEWQECGPCPSSQAKKFRLVRCIRPVPGSQEETAIQNDDQCSQPKPVTWVPCSCRQKRSVERHTFKTRIPNDWDLMDDLVFTPSKSKTTSDEEEIPKITSPEKKITLMQLENESEEAMLRQFRENQFKHNSPLLNLHKLFSGPKLNYSYPFKKRQINSHKDIANLKINSSINEQPLNENILPKKRSLLTAEDHTVFDLNKDLMNYLTNLSNSNDNIKHEYLSTLLQNIDENPEAFNELKNDLDASFYSKEKSINHLYPEESNISQLKKQMDNFERSDPGTVQDSVVNITKQNDPKLLKLLSANLPIEKLKQQQMNKLGGNKLTNEVFSRMKYDRFPLSHGKEKERRTSGMNKQLQDIIDTVNRYSFLINLLNKKNVINNKYPNTTTTVNGISFVPLLRKKNFENHSSKYKVVRNDNIPSKIPVDSVELSKLTSLPQSKERQTNHEDVYRAADPFYKDIEVKKLTEDQLKAILRQINNKHTLDYDISGNNVNRTPQPNNYMKPTEVERQVPQNADTFSIIPNHENDRILMNNTPFDRNKHYGFSSHKYFNPNENSRNNDFMEKSHVYFKPKERTTPSLSERLKYKIQSLPEDARIRAYEFLLELLKSLHQVIPNETRGFDDNPVISKPFSTPYLKNNDNTWKNLRSHSPSFKEELISSILKQNLDKNRGYVAPSNDPSSPEFMNNDLQFMKNIDLLEKVFRNVGNNVNGMNNNELRANSENEYQFMTDQNNNFPNENGHVIYTRNSTTDLNGMNNNSIRVDSHELKMVLKDVQSKIGQVLQSMNINNVTEKMYPSTAFKEELENLMSSLMTVEKSHISSTLGPEVRGKRCVNMGVEPTVDNNVMEPEPITMYYPIAPERQCTTCSTPCIQLPRNPCSMMLTESVIRKKKETNLRYTEDGNDLGVLIKNILPSYIGSNDSNMFRIIVNPTLYNETITSPEQKKLETFIKTLDPEIIFHPKDIEIIELIGRIKPAQLRRSRGSKTCDLDIEDIESVKQILTSKAFKHLTPNQCDKINSIIMNEDSKKTRDEDLIKELKESRDRECHHCYYIYGHSANTTTTCPPKTTKVN